MMTRFSSDDRGQAYVEFAIFVPVILIAFFSLIFFSRFGILAERAESAVRYGAEVSFKQGKPYTVATVYNLIDELVNVSPSGGELGPLCLKNDFTGSTGNAARISGDTIAALTQSQQIGSTPYTGTTNAIWKPDAGKTSTGGCNPASVSLGSNPSSPIPVSVTGVSLTTGLNIPAEVGSFINNGDIHAHMGFLQVAAPNVLVACLPGLQIVLPILNPNASGNSSPCTLNTTVPTGL